jgi:hypothetical protein
MTPSAPFERTMSKFLMHEKGTGKRPGQPGADLTNATNQVESPEYCSADWSTLDLLKLIESSETAPQSCGPKSLADFKPNSLRATFTQSHFLTCQANVALLFSRRP